MVLDKIRACGIVPVVKLNDPEKAVPLAEALMRGGINVIEITFRTAAAPEAIAEVTGKVPEMLVGAGTVLTVEQLHAARDAGAKFIVSPGLSAAVAKEAQASSLPILPGVVTPSEICLGLELGLKIFKFFPAENYGGISTVKALSAPFGDISFVPTGGINAKNAADYWKFPKVWAVGGSWMVPEKLIDRGNFDEITRLSDEAVELMWLSRKEAGL